MSKISVPEKPPTALDQHQETKQIFSKEHGRFNIIEFLPIIMNLDPEQITQQVLAKPSLFNSELLLSCEDRLRKTMHARKNHKLWAALKMELPDYFTACPRIIIFQNFLPGKSYITTLSLRNNSRSLKSLQLRYEESHYFSITYSSGFYSRIAPGMSATFNVHFTPGEKKDYSYYIAFCSEAEHFYIPVIAFGPRALLDFPDDIYIDPGPVKTNTTKMIVVRNIGDIPAVFSLITNSPFSVEPRKGILRPSELMNVCVSVILNQLGEINGILKIHFNTGEELHTRIYASAEEAKVWIDKECIIMPDTFIGMKQLANLKIYNGSCHLVNFKWKKLPSLDEEHIETDKLKDTFSILQKIESKKSTKLERQDILDPETHGEVYSRIYHDEVKALREEEFLFNHSCFKIQPLTGDLWPESSVEITVIFEPQSSGEHTTIAYCDIPGRENRLALTLSGVGRGPQFVFNIGVLDIDCVFVSTVHYYEIVAKNIGLIAGSLIYSPEEAKFGGDLNCEPKCLVLMPEQHHTLMLSFSSNVQGTFSEIVKFEALESKETFSFEIRGKVITPTLNFNIKTLNFGTVPVGFPVSHIVLLENLSMIPVSFELRMKWDGTEQHMNYKTYATMEEKRPFPKNPKEFSIAPQAGTVQAYSSLKVKVTLVPNIVRSWETVIVVDLVETFTEPIELPITYNASYPIIECHPSTINIRFCFINYPYTKSIVLENKSSIVGFFHIVPQQVTSNTTMTYSTSLNQGILKPKSKVQIPFTIVTSGLGKHSIPIRMIVLGEETQKEICSIVCNGQGPVVTAEPHTINYGDVTLLKNVTKELYLTNDSPIPADIVAKLGRPKSFWSVSPESSVLKPEKTSVLQVTVHLTDVGSYKDVCLIHVYGSRTLTVNLTAVGVGTSLVIEPQLCPNYVLGPLLTDHLIERRFLITNKGQMHHQILWSPSTDVKEFSKLAKDSGEQSVIAAFHIYPTKSELNGGEQVTLTLQGYSKVMMRATETIHCHAIVDHSGRKQILLSTTISGDFVDPCVAFSIPSLYFQLDIGPQDEFQVLRETISLVNLIDLQYNITLNTDFPFLMLTEEGTVSSINMLLKNLSQISITVVFDPSYIDDMYSKKVNGFLWVHFKEHTYVAYLPIEAEVNFPNMKLVSDVLDFGGVPVGCIVNDQFEIKNDGPLPITYHWFWYDGALAVQEEYIEEEQEVAPPYEINDEEAGTTDANLEKTNDNPDSEQMNETQEDDNQRESIKIEVADKDIKEKLFPIVSYYFQEDNEMLALENLPTSPHDLHIGNKFFEITPAHGTLGPYETQVISIAFNGQTNMSGGGMLVCQVDGGPSQVLQIKGKASNIRYTISKTLINFGNKIFGQPCSDIILIINTGTLPFQFTTDIEQDDVETSYEMGRILVEPRVGYLPGKTNMQIKVTYFPSLAQKFHEMFSIEIGYLNPIIITLKGYGVFPQLYAFLPRPKTYVCPLKIGYKAVEALSAKQFQTTKEKSSVMVQSNVPLFGADIPNQEITELIKGGWIIISYEDAYPTIADIDLEIERLIAFEHVTQNPSVLAENSSISFKPIQNLIVPPYEIDFGIVLTESTVSYSALFYNYGPVAVSAGLKHTRNKISLDEMGLQIQFRKIVKLPADHTAALQVVFSPNGKIYSMKRQEMNYTFYLEVLHGAKIPIFVQAVVTVPYLVLSNEVLNFGAVKCGECKTMSFILSNYGIVPCKWTGFIQRTKRTVTERCEDFEVLPYESMASSPFTFKANDFLLLPEQQTYVDIVFQPTSSGTRQMVMVILVEKNSEVLNVSLVGTGITPDIQIVDTEIFFEPTLPYPRCEEMNFSIVNQSPFPVEVFFPDFDSEIYEEERILRVLCHYYNKSKIALPPRVPGESLSKEITDFYQKLLNEFTEYQSSKNKDLELNSNMDGAPSGDNKELEKKLTNSSLAATTGLSIMGLISPDDPDILEISLHEYLDYMHLIQDPFLNIDPLKTANGASAIPQDISEVDDGVLIIFHGAPETGYIYSAHKAARKLKLSVLNVDQIILEAAAANHSVEALKIREIINSTYYDQITIDPLAELHGEQLEEEMDKERPYQVDPVDEMTKKAKTLFILSETKNIDLTPRMSISKKTEPPSRVYSAQPRPSTQQTPRRSGKRTPFVEDNVAGGTLVGIPIDLITEVIKKRLRMPEYREGVIIDSLNSIFITTPSATLTTLFRAVGNIKYLHCIIFHSTFDKYVELVMAEKFTRDTKSKEEMEKKVALFETITGDEVENLSERDQELYDELMLKKRKELWMAKQKEKMLQKRVPVIAKKKKTDKKMDVKKHLSKTPQPVQPAPASDSVDPEAEKKIEGDDRKKSKKMPKEPTTARTSKKTDVAGKSGIPGIEKIQIHFDRYGSDFNDLLQILLNWDRQKGTVSTGLALTDRSPLPPKGKLARKSRRVSDTAILTRLGQVSTEAGSSKRSSDFVYDGTQSTSEPTQKQENGVITWIIQSTDLNNVKANAIINLLSEFEELQQNRPDSHCALKPAPEVMHTCLEKPMLRNKTVVSSVFSFLPVENHDSSSLERVDSSEETTADPKDKSQKKTLKRKPKKNKSQEDSSKKEQELNPEINGDGVQKATKTRWILNPEEELPMKVVFGPHSVGEYTDTFQVEIVGWKGQHSIFVQGICDLPRIDTDPAVIFQKVVPQKEPKQIYRLTYYLDKQYYDFGAVLTTKAKEKRLHHIATLFNISNCSLLPVEAHFSFLDKSSEKVESFSIEPVDIIVEPGNTEAITVFANPHNNGIVVETIICSIKDNPTIETIKVQCNGVKIDFEVEPKQISFEHILLYRKDHRIIHLKNKSQVPVLWRFVAFEAFLQDFEISYTEGLIMPLREHDVRIDFYATKVLMLMKKPLKIEVFDEEGRGESLFMDYIYISAEAVDVTVEIGFSQQNENAIDFGNVKVGYEYFEIMQLKNKGKYDVTYRIEHDIPPTLNVPKLKKMLFIKPSTGTISHGDKPTIAHVVCFPHYQFHLYSLPIFKCYLLDGVDTVAIIPIYVSVAVYFSSFVIKPSPEMNFGVVAVGDKKIILLTITNTGMFEIQYTLSKSTETDTENGHVQNTSITSKMSSVRREDSKAKMNKIPSRRSELNSLCAGMFTLTPATGEVHPNESCAITVECSMETDGPISENIAVCIPEKFPDNSQTRHISLVAMGCLPSIDFNDTRDIFQEHYFCKNLAELECPKETSLHCVFIEDENMFMFCETCLGTTKTARLKFHNKGLVTCDISGVILGDRPSSQHKTAKSHHAPSVTFSVSPNKFSVLPYTTEYMELSFSPNTIEYFTASIEIFMDMPPPRKPQRQIFKISGKGCVPMVTLQEPKTINEKNHPSLVFGRTLLGVKNEQKIVLENTGTINCKVILEFIENQEKSYVLYPSEETVPLLINWHQDEAIQEEILATMITGSKATFNVGFIPNQVGQLSGELKISVVGNPYEKIDISLLGDSYIEDISLDNLKSSEERHNSEDDNSKQFLHELDLGYCYIGKTQKVAFKVTNHSNTDMYKFEFLSHPFVVMTPSVGHIKPRTSKEIIATFLTTEPVDMNKEVTHCKLDKIFYQTGIPEGTSWDDRLRSVHWVNEEIEENDDGKKDYVIVMESDRHSVLKQKVIECEREPDHYVSLGFNRVIPIHITAVLGYSSYSCEVLHYEFPDTLMFHQRTYEFTVSNSGIVPLTYNWNIAMDESYPIRPSLSAFLQSLGRPSKNVETASPTTHLPSSSVVNFGSPEPSHSSTTTRHTKHVRGSVGSRKKKEVEPTQPHEEEVMEYSEYCQAGHEKETNDDLFSFSESLDRSNDTWIDSDYMPFEIRPISGLIESGEAAKFTLKFAPLDVFDYKVMLSASIPYLLPKLKPLQIVVSGRSLMPFCHFDVEESDYLTSGRRNPSLPGSIGSAPGLPLDTQTKTIEFKVLGVGETHKKKFNVINPTEVTYSYVWRDVSLTDPHTMSLFHCATSEGILSSGKEAEMIISFTAHEIGVFESFWDFIIPQHDIVTHFLFVGTVTEPSVCLLNSHVLLCATVVGIPTTKYVSLVNNEEMNMKFNFQNSSLYSEGRQQTLKVQPLSGEIEPNQDLPVLQMNNINCIVLLYYVSNYSNSKPVVLSFFGFMTRFKEWYYVMTRHWMQQFSCFNLSLNFFLKEDHWETYLTNQKTTDDPQIEFTPTQPGDFSFNVKCLIKGMKKPLLLSVYGQCYSVQPIVTYEIKKNQICTLTPTAENFIDFGEIISKHPQTVIFRLTNIGKSSFYYHWNYDESDLKRNRIKLQIQEKGGHITSQSRSVCTMTLTVLTKTDIGDVKISLQISKGPNYNIILRARASQPDFNFSFSEYNFGLCFFRPVSPCLYSTTLYVKNNEETPLLVECFFENTSYLTLENMNGTIRPKEDKEIPIIFKPQDSIKYEDSIEFIINGCYKKRLKIMGEGVDLKVMLLYPEHKCITLAPVRPGCQTAANVPVVNDSKAPVTVKFGNGKDFLIFENSASLNDEESSNTTSTSTVNLKSTIWGSSPDKLLDTIDVVPCSPVLLKPHQKTNVRIIFKPNGRLKTFTEKIYMKIFDHIEPLCILKGSCIGPEFSLDRDYLPFGTVVCGCSLSQRIQLVNAGEIGSKFHWMYEDWNDSFNISPKEGYSSPGTSVTFTVTFSAEAVEDDIHCVANCCIENYDNLQLVVTGACQQLPESKEELVFNTPVRTEEKKVITLNNKSGVLWNLFPCVTGEYFYGCENITVPPHSSRIYEIVYTPLSMTKGIKHNGSVLFCLPEGKALLYSLIGNTEAPVCSGKNSIEIPCKKEHTELIPINNWLTVSQRFHVTTEVLKGEKIDPVFIFSGNKYIDIPGKTEREYRWQILCYKECTLVFKILFTNEESKEYLFHELAVKVVKCPPLETINLTTRVRQQIKHSIKLQNTFANTTTNYTANYTASDVYIKSPITVKYDKEKYAVVEYLPLFPGETSVSLDLYSQDLGSFPYVLHLTALLPIEEKLLRCTATLGSTATLQACVHNFAKMKCDFTCKIDSRDFRVDKQISVQSNQRGIIDITFEPTSIGNSDAILTAKSSVAGEYKFPLLGVGEMPQPQGPLSVKPGGSVTMNFKNIFHETRTFSLSLDNPDFQVKNSTETIKSKKEQRINISLKSEDALNFAEPITGKLTVSCDSPHLTHIRWVYYLKALTD